eukprot:811875_1
MGNLVPENECAEVDISNAEIYGSADIEWAYLIWFFVFIPMIFVSYGIIRCFGKISANFRCVPWIDQGTDVKETDHYDFIHFRGFAIKIKTILKAITISGLA